MSRNATLGLVGIFSALFALTSCTHGALIETIPPGAELYVNGVQVGITPYTLTDTVGSGERYEIVLQKTGYRIKQATLQQDEFAWPRGIASVACGACTLGLGCFGLLWSWQLKDRYAFTLETASAGGDATSGPASAPAERPAPAPAAGTPGATDPAAKVPL
jgi:hypothetical protein